MIAAPYHLWSTADGRLVRTGDEDAQTLVYPAGADIPDEVARDLGLLSPEEAESEADASDDPAGDETGDASEQKQKTPAAKTRKPPSK